MKYPMFKVHMPVDDALNKIESVLRSGFVNEGIEVTQFQDALKDYLHVDNLVLMNSCTSALTVAYKIAGVGPGTEVISTAMTCIATNTPIENLGAKIVWADVLPESGSIDPKDIEKKITNKTKAIVFVNWAGTPCDLEVIAKLGQKYGIPVIQDAAHAFGATWDAKPISDYADFTCYSFQAIKHLSSGDGGALVCKKADDFQLAKKLKWFGYDRDAAKDEKGEWKGQRWSADICAGEVGFKFNMNNISAAIGLAQMPYIQGLLDAHRHNADVYTKAFAKSSLIMPIQIPQKAKSSYWVYTCLTSSSVDRDLLLEKLNAAGVGAGLVHLSNDMYSAFKPYESSLPGTRLFGDRQISLPCGWWLTKENCFEIAQLVEDLAAESLSA
ncbi:DegT/DnrJ/EryC1/StrS family aminotransferase [Polynucleobacter victoriensis]|uniref:dTDP-4-amino-4,6-dideoxygalactose transaminase n=1 Tax=Polynucleobacter victoriensis TaxID=2049319 RepID=A0A212T831_9BURK|nr:DegT/DnrJ/EryC1/StrS family aminotransferase [Polynucleobacter victoriensis]SNC62213.1 dTDP-4-amino-4,6-dideoxygalactose transaminase [Polynucleobacter victoriensis]